MVASRAAMSFNQDQLTYLEEVITKSRLGDTEAIQLLRDVMSAVASDGPDYELIEIADFTAGFLRRHIQNHSNRN